MNLSAKIYPIALLLLSTSLVAQINPVRLAVSRMEKGKWDAARQLLIKSIKKDSLNSESKYFLSLWFIDTKNPDRQIDSAYLYAAAALQDFGKRDQRGKDRMVRYNLDSIALVEQLYRIDSLAFNRAKNSNTEVSYSDFIIRFSQSFFRNEAVELRDEVCYLDALKQNTEQAFKLYIERYPQSKRVSEATDRYDRLVFDNRTRDGKLSSYSRFVRDFANSPFYFTALQKIFEISTASGKGLDFEKFATEFPGNYWAKQAVDILFHKSKAQRNFPPHLLNDSLQNVMILESESWIPFFKNGKFGFMNLKGTERITERFSGIQESYTCGNIADEILITSEGLFARSGKKISPPVLTALDIGAGFLVVRDSTCNQLIHKSGRQFPMECFERASILLNRFIKTNSSRGVKLYALNGKLLTQDWNDIMEAEGLLLFKNQSKWLVCTPDHVALLADGHALPTTHVFDKITVIENHLLMVSNGSLEGILKPNLEFEIPLARQVLQSTPVGIIRKQNDSYNLASISKELEARQIRKMDFVGRWMVVYEDKNRLIYDLSLKKIIVPQSDSVWFDRSMALASISDSVTILFSSGLQYQLGKNQKVHFIPSPDTVRYFYTDLKNKKEVFAISSGLKLSTIEADDIESLTAETFKVTRKNKKFLFGLDGRQITNMDFDLMVKTKPTIIGLVKNRKFGLYETSRRKWIKPDFDRNLEQLTSQLLVAYQSSLAGVMDWNMKILVPFEYDEIKSWTDSVMWMRKGQYWSLRNIFTGEQHIDKVREFHNMMTDRREIVAMINREGYYGVISSRKGIILSPTFNDVVNVGSESDPVYFTEKRVEEAGISVVIYFDAAGNLIRKHVYEQDEYDRIYCNDN